VEGGKGLNIAEELTGRPAPLLSFAFDAVIKKKAPPSDGTLGRAGATFSLNASVTFCFGLIFRPLSMAIGRGQAI